MQPSDNVISAFNGLMDSVIGASFFGGEDTTMRTKSGRRMEGESGEGPSPFSDSFSRILRGGVPTAVSVFRNHLSDWYVKSGDLLIIGFGSKPHLEIGAHSYGLVRVTSWGEGSRLSIGRYCSISTISILLGGGHHRDVTTFPFHEFGGLGPEPAKMSRGEVHIGNDVWVGHEAIILDAVHVEDGAIIGAGSVVASDLPPYAVCLGNPAKVVKSRFTEQEAASLLASKWWDLEPEVLTRNMDLLYSKDVDRFVEFVRQQRAISSSHV